MTKGNHPKLVSLQSVKYSNSIYIYNITYCVCTYLRLFLAMNYIYALCDLASRYCSALACWIGTASHFVCRKASKDGDGATKEEEKAEENEVLMLSQAWQRHPSTNVFRENCGEGQVSGWFLAINGEIYRTQNIP